MSKKFRVAKAGQTTDGRNIPAEHIEQMAASYDPSVYGARINIEHLKSYSPDSVFRSYGDVVALTTETDDGDTYLIAEIEPTDELIALAENKQKVYFSIEYAADFADTKSAYLMGLACTDSPASLGTSYMKFCQQHPDENPLSSKKSNPDNIISTAEFSVTFEKPKTGIFNTVVNFLSGKPKDDDNKPSDTNTTIPEQENEQFNALAESMKTIAKAVDDMSLKFGQYAKQSNKAIESLQNQLDNTPEKNYTSRPPATGGDANYQKTDC